MKISTLATLALTALSARALPLSRRADISLASSLDDNDISVLNFALTLEHLENAFYTEALGRFDDEAFIKAGLPAFARGRFLQLAANERQHEALLTEVLGKNATQPCTYSFPFNDPASFAALSQALEGTGVSAYSGAAQLINDKEILTTAAVILSTEARHASWVASAVKKANPWSVAFDTPLSLDQVFTLAASFIVTCPSTNPPLAAKAFPPLNIGVQSLKPGSTVTVSFNSSHSSSDTFLAFFSGLSTISVPIKDGKATLPQLNGTVYAVVSTNGTAVSDSTILAGPAILDFAFDSREKLIAN